MNKICNKCNIEKPLDEFYKHNNYSDGYNKKCKKCYYVSKPKLVSTYIYVLTHPLFPNWVKIGRTTNIDSRLASYQTGCPNRAYQMNYIELVDDIYKYESYFRDNFICKNEWVSITVEEAICFINIIGNNHIV